jgi:parvulin-like peptidyl-prolyl isomerase
LPPGSWQGPIESGLGWHLVFIDFLEPGRLPDFSEVEPEVRNAWLSEQKAAAYRKAYDEMRAKYTILLPAGAGTEDGNEGGTTP